MSHDPNLDLEGVAGRAIIDLHRQMRVAELDRNATAGEVLDAVHDWFLNLGIDPDEPTDHLVTAARDAGQAARQRALNAGVEQMRAVMMATGAVTLDQVDRHAKPLTEAVVGAYLGGLET
jgi:hypothetical protein